MRVSRAVRILLNEVYRGLKTSVSDSNHYSHYRVNISHLEKAEIPFVEQIVSHVDNGQTCSFLRFSLYDNTPFRVERARKRTDRMVRCVATRLREEGIAVSISDYRDSSLSERYKKKSVLGLL